ncbi:hypothetical protein VC83_06655 [Pseudogymnoascus destructans]|uniref:Uncharacterized protein n=1 Tax=Pseudogymnoascus destructans TaxID=655981 RepID=A0A177A2G1_9PEZI|nr:uncharacterized protein VC83_06655 [Pseudogymnoascus destructans]OAF56348.1 hypothetical protein VC83_06655 [Pseudogymnoascus destructans]
MSCDLRDRPGEPYTKLKPIATARSVSLGVSWASYITANTYSSNPTRSMTPNEPSARANGIGKLETQEASRYSSPETRSR